MPWLPPSSGCVSQFDDATEVAVAKAGHLAKRAAHREVRFGAAEPDGLDVDIDPLFRHVGEGLAHEGRQRGAV